MHTTRLGLEFATRQKSVDLLQTSLSELIDLRLTVKQAHWTVTGARFVQLHELFDSFVAPLDEEIDTVAERIATLSGTPDGRSVSVGQNSELEAYPLALEDGEVHLVQLADRFAAVGNRVRTAVGAAEEAGDASTADLLTGTSRMLDKQLWLLEAHLIPVKAD